MNPLSSTRREFLRTSAVAASSLAFSKASNGRPRNDDRPNILFIMSDQHRWDALSAAHHPVLRTPNLDRLSNEGAWLRQATCAWPVCGATRASMLTGQYAHTHGVFWNPNQGDPDAKGLPEEAVTYDEVLKENGYYLSYWGKWHVGHKNQQCYDVINPREKSYGRFLAENVPEMEIPPGGAIAYHTKRPYIPCELDRVMKEHLKAKRIPPFIGFAYYGECCLDRSQSPTHILVNNTIDAMKTAARQDKPFHLTCSINPPHDPWIVSKPYSRMFDPAEMPVPESFHDDLKGTPYEGRQRTVADLFPKEHAEGLGMFMSIYFGLVAEVDYQIGRLLKSLEDLGLDENTLVIYTTDHGEMLGDHGMNSKGIFFEESVRIPMIMRFPGRIPSGKVYDEPANQVDLFSTILDYAGVPVPSSAQGESLRPVLEERKSMKREFAFSEISGSRMVRSKDWKYFYVPQAYRNPSGPEALYNLAEDPHEMRDALIEWGEETGDARQDELYRLDRRFG